MARRKRSEEYNTSIAEFIDMIATALAALASHPTCYPPWRTGMPTVKEIQDQMVSLQSLEDSVMANYQRDVHVLRDRTRRHLKGTMAELIGYIELLLYDPEILQRFPGLDLTRHPIDGRSLQEIRRQL